MAMPVFKKGTCPVCGCLLTQEEGCLDCRDRARAQYAMFETHKVINLGSGVKVEYVRNPGRAWHIANVEPLSWDAIGRVLTYKVVEGWSAPVDQERLRRACEGAQGFRNAWREAAPEAFSKSFPADDPGPVFKPIKVDPEHTALNDAMQQAEERAISSIASHFGLPKHLLSDAKTRQTCPDCKGSGEYRGLNTVEPCQTCGGQGVV